MDINSQLLLFATGQPLPSTGEALPASWSYQDSLSGWYSTWGSKYDTATTATGECLVKYIAYGNGILMAISGTGRIATSSDSGITWTYKPAGREAWKTYTTTPIHLSYGNGMWIAMDQYGRYMYSTNDGQSWTTRASPSWDFINSTDAYPNGLVYGNKWVFSVRKGVYYSTNGTTWTFVDNSGVGQANTSWRALAWNESLQTYIVVGAWGNSIKSSDGITWSSTSYSLTGTVWGSSRTPVLIGSAPNPSAGLNQNRTFITDGAGCYAWTNDGVNWTAYNDVYGAPPSWWTKIEHNYFGWMYSKAGTSSGTRITLLDNLDSGWSVVDTINLMRPRPYAGYTGVITSINSNLLTQPSGSNTIHGSTSGIITTNDGAVYNDSLSKFYSTFGFEGTTNPHRIFKGADGTYVVWCTGGNKVAISTNGSTWSLPAMTPSTFFPDTFIYHIFDKNPTTGKYIVIGFKNIYTTTDFMSWTKVATTDSVMRCGIYTGSRYIIGGIDASTYYSVDNGLTWTKSTSLVSTAWYTTTISSMTWNGTTAMITNYDGSKSATSINGVDWTINTSIDSGVVGALATNGTTFVKSNGLKLYYSDDNGQTWTISSDATATGQTVYDVQYSSRLQKFIACGNISSGGNIAFWYSASGKSWSFVNTNITTSYAPSSVLTGSADGKVFVGYNGVCISGV